MSHTEIYAFGPDGKPYDTHVDIKNPFRGAMAIWNILEERYLPSLPKPSWEFGAGPKYYSRTIIAMMGIDKMDEIWQLVNDERLSRTEKIVLASTLDKVLVKGEDIPELLTAFREFDGDTNLPAQADGIEILLKEYDVTAIGFNQTSVNSCRWVNYEMGEDEEFTPYNYLECSDHWWLFDQFKEECTEENKNS
jgi:hypothetical protein